MFEQMLTEAFNNASYLDVTELRTLYYGRLNMYTSFTDNSKYITSEDGRPDGIICHTIDTVVGRKATTPLLYAYVFRIDKDEGKFIEDIRTHTTESLETDISAMYLLPYLKEEDIEYAVRAVKLNPRIHRPFERLWEIGRRLAKDDGELWCRIYTDIGYIGFADPYGTGIIGKRRTPVTLLLDTTVKTDFDIVPIQKYRVDPRARIRDDVNRVVKRLQTARNRVAKAPTPAFRAEKKKASDFEFLANFIKGYIK